MHIPWGGAENIYRRVGLSFQHLDKEHWRIHCVCRLSFTNFSPDDRLRSLRNAWKSLVIEFPRLAVRPNGTTSKIYRVLSDETDVENWANESFFVELEKTPGDVVRTLGPCDLPSLHFLPASSEIVLLTSHWRMDGVGALMLLDRLLTLVVLEGHSTIPSSPENQCLRVSPSLEDAANCPPMDASPASTMLKSYANSWIDNMHRQAINASGLPYNGDNTTPPGDTTQETMNLTPSATKALMIACKSKAISISAAVHAALAQTVFSLSPEDDKSDYTTVMAVNLRPYLPPPYNGPDHAVQTYVASIIPTVPRNQKLTEAAQDLTRTYRNWYSEEFIRALRWIYTIHAERLFKSPPKPSGGRPKPPSGVTLSSLGVVEGFLKGAYDGKGKGVMVEQFSFGVTMMTRQMLLYVWTFAGRLTLSLCYNEAYYQEAMAREVLERLRDFLESELAVSLDVE
ncbi:hypothetical protein ASPVEDRAFT_140537 [Aspergillus versicolor CBS 583.65]|uniref:Phthiocerol/phthiodiolone dimycocerosyl transferase C-terminal domain-containing protein n=1 Tax=Aspergillus versicolor CBS 583.65 TaxID=1036611 RepID=A0A1L9PY68_ASPVE|nr:uncharacterized protein ASPVEDRAFT_140537 [Aspergillus versicolor CBS 583.65]OJJ06458.1 hypothetical protein ASPVEDRAFT_140537 [Aspergillus versicolor CBS 583.65]